MVDPVELIAKVRSGVAQIGFTREKGGPITPTGTAFLVKGGLVTCCHCIPPEYHTLAFRFPDSDPNQPESYTCWPREKVQLNLKAHSLPDDQDYAYLTLWNEDFRLRHKFDFTDSSTLSVGEQVLFLGFPFGGSHLTAHMGYVSSVFRGQGGIETIQIDGSINRGNSGGPLLKLDTGKVVGIVTRAMTGFMQQQLNQLLSALRQNQRYLSNLKTGISICGMSQWEPDRASMAAIEKCAEFIAQSANVGIGHAYSANYVSSAIEKLGDRTQRIMEQGGL